MILSKSSPVSLTGHRSWVLCRRISLLPHVFQLRANRSRVRQLGCNVHEKRYLSQKAEAPEDRSTSDESDTFRETEQPAEHDPAAVPPPSNPTFSSNLSSSHPDGSPMVLRADSQNIDLMFGFDQTAAAQKSGKRRGRPPTSQGPSFNQAPVPRPVEKELTWTSAIYQAEIERLENAPSPCAVSTSDALGERLDLAVLRMDMRKTLGKTAKSAVIVTTRDKEDTLHPAKGLTVSSFTSVSFYPEIIVSLNLRERSTSLDAIQQSNIFHVHIMKANEQAVEMVSRFACGPRAASGAFKVQRTLATRHAARSERNVEHLLPPFLGGLAGPLDGVASRITCKYMPDKTVEVGDHVVIFGVVQNVVKVDPLPDEQTPYLAYASGSFGSVNPLAMPTFGLRDIREKVEQTVSREALVTRKWEEPPPNSVGADANHQPPIRPYLYTEREVQRIQMARLPETRPLNMTEDPAYEEIERETSWEDKEPLDEAKRKQMQADIDSVMADIEGMFPKKSQMTARLMSRYPDTTRFCSKGLVLIQGPSLQKRDGGKGAGPVSDDPIPENGLLEE